MKLQDLALDNGPDVNEWPADDQREAVIELFENDERENSPDWICDALVENVGTVEDARRQIIDALKLDSAIASEAVIGKVIRDALLAFPLDWLTDFARGRYPEWRAEQSQCQAEALADSAPFARDTQRAVLPLVRET